MFTLFFSTANTATQRRWDTSIWCLSVGNDKEKPNKQTNSLSDKVKCEKKNDNILIPQDLPFLKSEFWRIIRAFIDLKCRSTLDKGSRRGKRTMSEDEYEKVKIMNSKLHEKILTFTALAAYKLMQ